MTSKAGLIIEELRQTIISLPDYTDDMLHYFPPTADVVNIDEADLPYLVIYCDAPKTEDQVESVTRMTIDIQIVYYYRHADGVAQDSLIAMQNEQDYMKAMRGIVYQLQKRQGTTPGVPDLWVSSDSVQLQGRPTTFPIEGEDNPVYTASMEFIISFEEDY